MLYYQVQVLRFSFLGSTQFHLALRTDLRKGVKKRGLSVFYPNDLL